VNDSLDEKCLIEGRPIATSALEPKLFIPVFGSGTENFFVPDPNPDPAQGHTIFSTDYNKLLYKILLFSC
jgi:hypothetical protein